MKTNVLLIVAFSAMSYTNGWGQSIPRQLIAASGDEYKNSTYQLDWSLGETMTEVYSSGNTLLTQGFQQGNIFISAIEDVALPFDVQLSPNPAKNFIWLKISGGEADELSFIITDLSGKIQISETHINENNSIDLSKLSTGVYFLTLHTQNNKNKVFKISKTY